MTDLYPCFLLDADRKIVAVEFPRCSGDAEAMRVADDFLHAKAECQKVELWRGERPSRTWRRGHPGC
jgi:hypothetical protein